MKRIIVFIFRIIYEISVKAKLIKPAIVIHVDGGVCSQMHQYLLGYFFMKKGYRVEYDLSWYLENGMDLNKRDVRNFDLLNAFPSLNFKEVNKYILKLYRHFYVYKGEYPNNKSLEWTDLVPPKLFLGYYADPDVLYTEYFQEAFPIDLSVLDAGNLIIYQEIIPEKSAAVHVRRGDLAVETNAYGVPATLEYFKNGIDFLKKKMDVKFFYLFSDDKEYLRKELIPYVGLHEMEYRIIQNGADKGYFDMILMSRCNHVITSKGTLGKYGALLNLKEKKTVVVCKDDKQTFMLNVKLIEKIAL